jgi:kynurenine formamidase
MRSPTLTQLVDDLNAGRLEVVDLTQPLGPSTPVIGLPPMFAPSPGVTIDVISRYNDKGPAWYWNTLRMGEHTGTHFDAPIHWITGKDLRENACDTIPVRRFVGPACVIDITQDVERDADFLLTPARIEAWESEHGRIPPGAWVLLRTGWSRRTAAADFLNVASDGPHSPGFDLARRSCSRASARCSAWASRQSARMRVRPARSIRRFPIMRSCTAPAASASRASATSIGCHRRARSSSRLR